ncbi:hypothetical protein CYY_002707 [Polysphondylium violaceum]|uniref:Uncharacterized protein n=1 Tax=Polysphondylium violaceum TaxID=133409 RepID=A0A8J4PYE7_9MYCE|nr:hypothetical protein CYY_002707 [Polysphondylium violaceum]
MSLGTLPQIPTTTTKNSPLAFVTESRVWKYIQNLPYPGKIEEVGHLSKALNSDDSFDGFKIDVGINHQEGIDSAHSFNICTPNENNPIPKYNYQLVYAKGNTFCLGRLDSDRKLVGKIGSQFLDNRLGIYVVNSMNKEFQTSLQLESDFRLNFANIGFKLDNQGTRILGFYTSLTKNFSFGYESTYVPMQGAHIQQIVARRNSGPLSYFGSVNNMLQMNLGVIFKKDNLEAASDFMAGMSNNGFMSHTSVSARYHFRNNALKARVDTAGELQFTLDEGINPFVKVQYVATMNYFTNEYKFCAGLTFNK